MTAEAMRIGVLGPLEVCDAAGRPVRVGGQRVRALLTLLALEAGCVVPSQALIDRLWPRNRPSDAANALQSLVSRLRQALRQAGLPQGLVESSPAGYRLAISPRAVDALAFEELARAGRRALADGDPAKASGLLREALGRWRGSALADVAGEDFAVAPAGRLADLHAAATLDRIEADLTLGAADAALIGELREVAAADRLAERPAALLMRALAATGRQAEALAVYQDTRDQLAEGLGVDPSALLGQAHLAVLRQEIPPATVHPSTPPGRGHVGLRRPPTSFIGRDDDVAALLKRLDAGRLVTLTGPGGVGKTRLATEAAALLTGPAWFAPLAPVSDPAEVPHVLLDALGLLERSIAPRSADLAGNPAGRLAAALADRAAVLILDNCEHLIDAVAALTARLLDDCPELKILATSREPLQIPGEALCVVAPLAAPGEADPVAVSAGYPAMRLFVDRAAAVLPGFELTEDNASAVASICRNLDGMPLAIELAAPWLRTLSPAQLALRLGDRFALLTGGSRTALPRHQTLRAVVEWSWDLLSERERVLLRRLAVFPGGATLSAAEQACAGLRGPETAPLPAGEVLPALAGLVSKSLLTRSDSPGGEPRYRMLDTVRAYGLERLAEAGEEAETRDAAARYCLELAETADPLLRTAGQVTWFRVLTAEQDNLSAAIRWAIARPDAETALRFVRALGYYWVQRGHGEADALCRDILAMTPPPLTLRIAEARIGCALLAAGWNWDIDSVREPLQAALADLRELGADDGDIHPLAAMAEPVMMQFDGAADQALARFSDRLGKARDPWLRAIMKVNMASYALSLGQPDSGEEWCRAGLAESRGIGDQWGVAVGLTMLAEFTELRADHATSIEVLTEASAIGRELGVWGDLSYVEGRLAVIHGRAGNLALARVALDKVRRDIESRGGSVDSDRWVSFMHAELAALSADHAEVVRRCAAVLATISKHEARWWESLRAVVKARLSVALLRQGHPDRCAQVLSESIDAAAAWWERPSLATVLDACAVYALDGDQRGDPRARAGRAARLLGAACAARGTFDESNLDARRARDAARAALDTAAFAAHYEAGLADGYEAALALARDLLAS